MSDTPRDCEHGQLARSCEICELKRELAQRTEALTAARAGQPLGPIVGAQTIVNQQHEINRLADQLAAVTAELANIKNLQRIGNQILDAESGG